jgi:cytochrome c551/c552
MKRSAKIGLGAAALIAAIQVPQCERTNPPVTGPAALPAPVEAVLRRACYDCHSNETVWPWYSRLAPVSWLLHRDVVEGRRHLNFSEWDKVAAERRARKLRDLGHEVESGDMPPWFYLPMHPNARLSDADKQMLQRWSAAAAPLDRGGD